MTKTYTTDTSTLEALVALDSKLGKLFEQYEPIEIVLQEDYFMSIASAIVGQQLSNRVAEVLWERLTMLLDGVVSPMSILSLDDEELRQIGISYAKIKYLKALAMAIIENTLDLEHLDSLSDDEVVRQLTQIVGIGPWTAEMFLIFSMGRPDVFSVGDGGLQRAIKWLYGMEVVPQKEELLQISEKWRPYRTTVALYLWRALDEKVI